MSRKFAGTAKPPFLPDFCAQKSRRPRKHDEDKIQQAVVEMLEHTARPGVEWLAIHNNPRSARDGARFKRMGGKRGVSDLLLIRKDSCGWPEVFWLEIKTDIGRLSDEQRDFQNRMTDAGCYAATAYGLTAAIKILRSWDLIIGRVQ